MAGLFSTFNVAKRGMEAQQTAIDVTAHNISNAKTAGYSRQRANMETTRPAGMPSMNNSMGPGQLGTGVQVSSIVRIRDTFLDYQVRVESGTKGWYEGRESFLREIEGIMNEPSDTGVSTLLGKTFDSWSELSKHAESSNARTVVAQQSKALTDELNNTYNQLIKLKGGSQDVIGQNVVDINSILDQMNDLNQQVISVKVGGNEPNDLMDKRDLLVDQLSSKFGINIDKKNLAGEDVKPLDNVGGAVAAKDLYLVKANPTDKVSRFSYIKSIVPKGLVLPTVPPAVPPAVLQKSGDPGFYEVTYYKNGDMSSEKNKVTMTMNLSSADYKSLDEGRVLWADKQGYAINKDGDRIEGTEFIDLADLTHGTTIAGTAGTAFELFKPKSGELKGYMSVQEDIDKYVDQLDSLAKSIAFSINAVHSGKTNATGDMDDLMFFENSSGGAEAEITAGNISVNKKILDDVMSIKVGKGETPGAGDGNRALAISTLRDARLEIQSIDRNTTREQFLVRNKFETDTTLGVKMVNSNLNGMAIGAYFKDTVNRVAVENQAAQTIVKNQGTLIASLEKSRTSISGVSLDEEMVNMIQYQHAYQANAKIISTVDQLLDVVINGLKK